MKIKCVVPLCGSLHQQSTSFMGIHIVNNLLYKALKDKQEDEDDRPGLRDFLSLDEVTSTIWRREDSRTTTHKELVKKLSVSSLH